MGVDATIPRQIAVSCTGMGAFLLLILLVVVVLVIVSSLSKKGAGPAQSFAPRPGGGSMGRVHQQMNPQAAASTIYSNLKARGGLQPGRVYSTGYFASMMPAPMYGFAEDWLWWQLVFSSLNGFMAADGYGFPAYAYDYGGQSSIFFGDPNAGMMPQFYSDPMMDSGVPMDYDPNAFVAPDTYPTDPGDTYDQGQAPYDAGQYDPTQSTGQGDDSGSALGDSSSDAGGAFAGADASASWSAPDSSSGFDSSSADMPDFSGGDSSDSGS